MRVVITGGKRGIGTAITAHFRARGDDVVPLSSADLDVTDEAAVAHVLGELGPVDVLVNNAGVSSSAPVKRTTLAEWPRFVTWLTDPGGGGSGRRRPDRPWRARRHRARRRSATSRVTCPRGCGSRRGGGRARHRDAAAGR